MVRNQGSKSQIHCMICNKEQLEQCLSCKVSRMSGACSARRSTASMISTKGLPVRCLCVRAASSNALADLQHTTGLAAQAPAKSCQEGGCTYLLRHNTTNSCASSMPAMETAVSLACSLASLHKWLCVRSQVTAMVFEVFAHTRVVDAAIHKDLCTFVAT